MNITQESTGNLTAMIKIEMIPGDYEGQVNNTLKELQKKSSLKGFRPGKVPFGLVKKMYEKGVIAEEVNKILSDSLNKYIVDNKLEILGYPLANTEKTKSIDFDNDTQFDFFFDIGFAPAFELDLTQMNASEYYDIQVEDKVVDNYLEDTRKRFGKFIEVDSIEESDLIEGEIIQLDEYSNPVENGINKKVTIALRQLKDESSKTEFIGKKNGEKIRFNPLKASGSAVDTAAMLGIKKEEAENLQSDFDLTILTIRRIEPAEVNEEFFNKVYPAGDIKDLEQFRQKIRDEAKGFYQTESENYFVHSTLEKFNHDIQFELPEEFIKRWLVDSDGNLTLESVEQNMNNYLGSLKQQLIIGKISKDYDVIVSEQEIKDHIKNYFIKQSFFDPNDEEKSKYFDSVVESVMKKKEEVTKIHDQLFDEKVKVLLKEKMKIEKKEVTYEDFVKIVNEHHKIHHHEHS
jgi:trigger factor